MKTLKLSDFRKELPIKIQSGMCNGYLKDLVNGSYGRKIDFDIYLPTKGKNLQRPLCWNLKQKQELIYSILKGVRIQNFTVIIYTSSKTERQDTLKIVDGKQRLSTLISFCNNEFPIEFEGENYFYQDLPADIVYVIDRFSLTFDQTYEYYDDLIPDDVKIAWFEQLNFAGTPQDIEHLNNLKS